MGRPLRPAASLFLIIGACGCSQGAAPPTPDNVQKAAVPPLAAAEAKAPAASGQGQRDKMATSTAAAGQRRCGWLQNPTPGNWWLDDRDGQWVLATQGREPPPGMDEMPDMSTAGWVETNGHYGYGCACLTIAYDPATEEVTRIADAEPKPLKQCRADKALPRPE